MFMIDLRLLLLGGEHKLPKDIIVIGNTTAGHTLADCDFLVTTDDATSVFQEALDSVGNDAYSKHLTLYLLPAIYYFTPITRTNNSVTFYTEQQLLLPLNVSQFEIFGNSSTILIDDTEYNDRECVNTYWNFIKYRTFQHCNFYDIKFDISLGLTSESHATVTAGHGCNLYRCQFNSSCHMNLDCYICEDCTFDNLRESINTTNHVRRLLKGSSVTLTTNVRLKLTGNCSDNIFRVNWNTDGGGNITSLFNIINCNFCSNRIQLYSTNKTAKICLMAATRSVLSNNIFQQQAAASVHYIIGNDGMSESIFSNNIVECQFTWIETIAGETTQVVGGHCDNTIISNNRFKRSFVEPDGDTLFITGNIMETDYIVATNNSSSNNVIAKSNNFVNGELIT